MSRKKPNTNGSPPEPADEHDRKLLTDVKQYGWHVIGIEEDEEGPSFAYSIGLQHSLHDPEIIVFGLPVQLMHQIINGIGEKVRSGERFEHLDEWDDILDGYNVAFRNVERKHFRDYFGYARWFYRGDDFSALQCVWPDSQHRYPWHPEAPAALIQRQPLLTDDQSWPFHEGRNRAVFTTRPVLEEGHPILLVTHDTDDSWQFLCGTTNRTEDAKIVSLGSILERDGTLAEVANLPEGWRAFRRERGSAWSRERLEEAE
jgi:hypothetical protein